MSKKLAGGADCILLDVKYGEGAFMKTVEDARELADTMITIGRNLGREVNAMLSNMNQPLGHSIGNAFEVKEAIMTLKNEGPKDLEELCLVASGYMLFQADLSDSPEAGYELAKETLQSGAAYETFLKWIQAQGGDVSVFDNLDHFTNAKYEVEVFAEQDGYLHDLKAMELGIVSMHLGAGRQTKEDVIDYKAGIVLRKEIGDIIHKGDLLATLYSDTPITDDHKNNTVSCFIMGQEAVEKPNLIAAVL
nr:hypothetical protein [Erysipelothrix piscisicarius]